MKRLVNPMISLSCKGGVPNGRIFPSDEASCVVHTTKKKLPWLVGCVSVSVVNLADGLLRGYPVWLCVGITNWKLYVLKIDKQKVVVNLKP